MNRLEFTHSEAFFWRNAARHWQEHAGLLVLYVPEDYNQYDMAKKLREIACSPGLSGQDRDLTPGLYQTFCYQFNMSFPSDANGFFQPVWEDSDKQTDAENAAHGRSPFFLIISGIHFPSNTPVVQWMRLILEHWPGDGPCTRKNSLHLCILASGPRATNIPPLPDTCELLVFPESPIEEIGEVILPAVREIWQRFLPSQQRYIAFGIIDMSSGRRTAATIAIETISEEWDKGARMDGNWRPRWRKEHPYVQHAINALAEVGLDRQRFEKLLSRPYSSTEEEEATLAAFLWGKGLWTSSNGGCSLWQGLTTYTRAALESDQASSWVLPPVLPTSSLYILQRTLYIEQLIKRKLLERLERESETPHQQNRSIRTILYNKRTSIREKAHAFQVRLSVDELEKDSTLLSICSLGELVDILRKLLPNSLHSRLVEPLSRLASVRNYTAHCGWFSNEAFLDVCQEFDIMESKLSLIRLE